MTGTSARLLRWSLVLCLACLWPVSCSLRSTGTNTNPTDANNPVQLVRSKHGQHQHPVPFDAEVVSGAMLKSGFFLGDEVESLARLVHQRLAQASPNQEAYLELGSASYLLYSDGGYLLLKRYQYGEEMGESKSPIPQIHPADIATLARPKTVDARTVAHSAGPEVPEAPKPVTTASTLPRRLWLLSIGISRYYDSGISLAYAAHDASAMHELFSRILSTELATDSFALLANEQATRAKVLSKVTEIGKRAGPEDLIVLYMAVHGLPEDAGELYFLAYDTDPKNLVGTGLPQRDIEYALTRTAARRIVMILDACHSGGAALDRFAARRGIRLAETNRLLQQLATAKSGVAVLTASSASESSFEGQQWEGHGVFTYFLLEGLSGRAAKGDGIVTIRELFDYVYSKVSEATKGNQHPELKGSFDNDLPVIHVK